VKIEERKEKKRKGTKKRRKRGEEKAKLQKISKRHPNKFTLFFSSLSLASAIRVSLLFKKICLLHFYGTIDSTNKN